ncbi:exported protein [Vibrio ponticus]|nr:exported protein [Vibrio ponticus]
MTGQAIDFRLDGVNLRKVRDIAREIKAGGVGYYPNSNFVHIDTGPVRYWS